MADLLDTIIFQLEKRKKALAEAAKKRITKYDRIKDQATNEQSRRAAQHEIDKVLFLSPPALKKYDEMLRSMRKLKSKSK